MMKTAVCIAVTLVVLLLPVGAYAQAPAKKPPPPSPFLRCDPPNASPGCPHPTQPWFGLPFPGRPDYGNVVRYLEVPAQQVAVPVYVPGPGSFSGDYQPQTVEIPGYVVTETTTGYLYPERWSLEQVTQGVYQWRVLPPLFTRK